jgi:DNA (cytosine-5)-methyltransferase 1
MRSSISLFSGIGGFDEGIHQAGFSPIFCSELDRNAFASLGHWCNRRKVSPILERDINEIDPIILKKKLGFKVNELDLLAGGPPCQSFSLIGSRRAMADDRGLLLFKMVEFAQIFQPKAVLIEQVKGLLSAKGADGKSGSALASIISALENCGYSVSYQVLRAADYGAPQLRDRVFIVGLHGNKKFQFPVPTHFDPEKENGQQQLFRNAQPYLTLQDAIGDLPRPSKKGEPEIVPSHVDITPSRDIERITGVPEGQCLARQLHLPAQQRQRLNPDKDTTKFRRMAWNKPALTLRGGEAFYHPTENRYLTPREFLRIHGFPDEHILFGPIRGRSGSVRDLDQHRLVANAVPPPLAKAVAAEIFKQLFGE